jgi:nitrite reductase/ring-hydroxylating ferredoxin subunit
MGDMQGMSFKTIMAADSLAEGQSVTVNVDGRSIIICHSDGGYFAADDLCPHNGARLGGGKVRKDTVACPVHGARFDLHTGECLAKALGCASIVTHELRIENGQIEVALSDKPVQQPMV